MPKNYYLLLGIPIESTIDEVKTAFRRLAKEYHPDHSNEDDSIFLGIQEAYSVLGDPKQKRKYDKELADHRKRSQHFQSRYHASRAGVEEFVEPLIPENDAIREEYFFREEKEPQPFRPASHSLMNQWLSDFADSWIAPETDAPQLEVGIYLSWYQARQGGQVRIMVPSNLSCPECDGSGSSGFYECWRCSGSGYLKGGYPLVLSYPPGIKNNHSVNIRLSRYGDAQRYIRVIFVIE